jgi:3'(2'), 5'-bisphosphate nucleotidase
MHISNYLSITCEAAIKAGALIMRIYEEQELVIRTKADKSPVTQADMESSELICNILQTTGFPVISEEISSPDYEVRKNWDYYWLVDPLDGTKEFIKRNNEFTVNIALVEKNLPVLGVIYIPAKGIIYFGIKGLGTWKKENVTQPFDVLQVIDNEPSIKCQPDSGNPRIITSRSHTNEATHTFIEKMKAQYSPLEIIEYGSSVKLCLIAEGKADIYPRFGPTMEWDTAAGQVFADNSGIILKSLTGSVLTYNKPDLHNPDFIAYNPTKFPFDDFFTI